MKNIILAGMLLISSTVFAGDSAEMESGELKKAHLNICLSLKSAISDANTLNLNSQVLGSENTPDVLPDLLVPYDKLGCKDIMVAYQKSLAEKKQYCVQLTKQMDAAWGKLYSKHTISMEAQKAFDKEQDRLSRVWIKAGCK